MNSMDVKNNPSKVKNAMSFTDVVVVDLVQAFCSTHESKYAMYVALPNVV